MSFVNTTTYGASYTPRRHEYKVRATTQFSHDNSIKNIF
jgi:hypothetical protein